MYKEFFGYHLQKYSNLVPNPWLSELKCVDASLSINTNTIVVLRLVNKL